MVEVLDNFRLGIIAGAGNLPGQIAERFDPGGKSVFFIALEGITDPSILKNYDHLPQKLPIQMISIYQQ